MWDQRYREQGYAFGVEPNDFLRESAAHIPAGRVLSLAEGEGRNAVYLASLGYAVTGVDQSTVGLGKARALAGGRSLVIDTQVADLADYAIEPETWDGIVSIFAHLPTAVRRRLYASVIVGLRPGGVFILEAYGPAQPTFGTGGPSDLDLLPPLAELRDELDGLEFVIARELERPVVEGRYHTGQASVVQIVGRKPAQ